MSETKSYTQRIAMNPFHVSSNFGDSNKNIIFQYVTLGDYTYLKEDLLPSTDCRAVLLPENFYPSGFGIVLPQDSPFKPVFDHK